MRLSDLSIEALKLIVIGEYIEDEYLSGPDLVKFFNNFGQNDSYDFRNGGLPEGLSRSNYAVESLNNLNGGDTFIKLIEALVDNRKTKYPDKTATKINEIIKYDGYTLIKNESEIYKLHLINTDNKQNTEAYFKDIKNEIINNINDANFLIWVAVAWFTDKDLGNKLREKHMSGLNIRVIVNDDITTQKYGLDFNSKGIEYIKISPNSIVGKKLMHNKFCIIDMKKVIHGSFNWTSNANYNKETITITEGKDICEKFATEFIKLVNEK